MNPYLKPSQKNINPPYDDATINKFNAASSSALGYLQNRLNDPIYYKRLQNETTQSNKLGNVTYDPKTGALDLLNQRKKGLNEAKFINPNTTDQSEIAIINEIKNKGYLGAFTTGQVGRYEPEYQKEGFMKGALKQDIAGFQKNVIGVNPIMFNKDYEKYLENIIIHEGEHSTQPAYPNYTNPYYNVGMMNVDNGTLPLYRNKSNITPYATNVIKENILSDDNYYSDPMEVVASKRQIEHLFENAPEGTFKKTWKYGDDIQDEHFNYFLDSKNNVQSAILKKALLGDKNLEDLNEEEKQDLKNRFSNIMTKIAYNENNNDNIYTARFGTKVKGKNANPYLKKYGPGGETDPYDPTTSYIRPKKVIVDGKEMSTYSNEYRDLYNTGNLMSVDYDGIPVMYGPEVEVTAKMTDEEREKRLRKQSYDPNLTERENEKKYQAKKAIQGWMKADINQPGGLQRAGEAMTFPLRAAGASANLLSETLNIPLAFAGEYISGRNDYGSALPSISRSMNNAGLTGFPGFDNPNPNQQITPGSAIFPDNPYAAMALDLPADLLISRGSGTLYKQGIKQGMKNIVPQLKYAVNDIITKPKKSSLEWMNEWYSSPEFLSRYSKTGKYSDQGMQEAVLEQLNEYKPKNYIDLWKDKGFKEWAQNSMDSGGLSYGVPDQVYVNRTLNPFKKGRESVRTHELTHLIENNGHWLSKNDEKALLKPFNYNNFEEVIPDKVSFFTGPGKQYYLKPTEIHARINQARYDLNLKPTDVFTEEMFDKINKGTNWYGMGKYIKDKKAFIDLMNNFWAVAPAVIGTGAAGVGLNEMMKQQKQEYRKGGIVNPYLSYNNGGKVIVNGKEINIDSNEYRKMYESGNLMNVDKDGIPVRWSNEEAVVTAKLTDEEKKNIEKKRREQEAMYNTLQAGLNAGLQDGFDNQGNPIFVKDGKGGIDAALGSALFEGLPELTGIPSLIRVSKDPMGHLNSVLRTMDGISTFGTMPDNTYETPEDFAKTLDVVGAAGTVLPLAKAAKVPFFKVPKINPNAGLSYADEVINQSTKNANSQSSLLNVVDDVYVDATGNKINPKEVQRFIEDEGLKIIKEGIETPEGRRRLAEQFKKSNPKLTADEIDNLIETRIAESKASVIHNRPRHFNEVIVPGIDSGKKPFLNLDYFFNEIFPLNNAHWTPLNPSYPAVQSNLPSGAIRLARKQNPFTNPEFTPGSITLGRGYADDLAVLDHELGHAAQKGGQMPIDKELMQLLKPKSIFDKGYEWFINKVIPKTKNDYNYFSKSGGRTWKNEPYPFVREARRQMIEDGILKDTYDKVTPLKLFKHFMGNNASRIIDFTPPWKYSALAKKFNEAPALVPGIIGTGAAGIGANEIMKQTPQNRHGGQNPYITPKYKYGGPVEPVDPEEQLQKTKEYLLSMVNSPLLKERYAASKGKRIEDVTENELAEYKEKISQNINTAKMGDYYKIKPKYKAKETDGFYYPPYTRKEKESGLQDIIDMSKLVISEGGKITDKNVKNLLDFEDNYAHKFFMTKNKYTPGTISHEYSHASTRANEDLDFKGEAGKYNINEERINKYPDLYKYYKDDEEYYIDPTEQKARIDAVRQWMRENKIYDSTKERFDENHYNLLRENYNNSPESLDESTKDQMMDLLFPYDKTELIRMFNTYTKNINNENNPYLNYSRFGTKISKYNNGGPVDPVDPEEERRLMQERLMRYIRGNNESNNSILDVRSPNEYGFSLGNRFKIQSGLSLDPMTGMPSGYGKLGINNNGFNLGIEKKKGIGTDASIYNIGYEGPKFNIGASYSKENNIPSISGNIGYNNNGINIGVGGNYSPYNKGISANLGYNNNGINAGLNYNYSGQHSISGNIGYGNDIYNVGLSGNVMPGESNVGINATYNLGVRKPQKREEIAMAYNKPIEINLIKEEDDTDTDAEQAVGPPEMNYGGYVNPDDPTLPSAPVNLFSNYDMGYNNPFVDDIDSAMNGMMKARMAIESEIGMNPAAKRMTSLYPKEYTFTGDEMFYDEKQNIPAGATGTHYTTGEGNVMFPIIQEGQDGNLFFNRYASPTDREAMRFETPEEASYFGENYKNIAPMMYNQQEYEKGGDAGHSTVEIERSERVYTPDGKLIMETPADAPTHEEGGVKVTLPAGSLVFPKKYYKALDAASGLPEFKKIAKTMLDNAEKAYLRGEPYSSGGKRQ